MIFLQVLGGAAGHDHPWESSFPWLALSTTTVLPFGIMVDPLAAMMLVVVTTVALLVQIYSRGYIWEPEAEHGQRTAARATGGQPDRMPHGPDARRSAGHARATHADHDDDARPPRPAGAAGARSGLRRFFAYLGLFTAAMLGLVLANNLLVMYMFWEGVGLGSYLLIGFWYQPDPPDRQLDRLATGREMPIISGPAEAAKKAFVTTRFGDFGFLLGILLLWWHADTLEFTEADRDGRARRIDLGRPDGRRPAAVHGRGRQVGAVPAARLAPGRDGGPDPGQRADPRRDDGRGGRLPGGAGVPAVRARADGDADGGVHRRLHGDLRRHRWAWSPPTSSG